MAKSVGSASKSQTTGKRADFTAESTVVTDAARIVGADAVAVLNCKRCR
jgi:hypothetical protein